MKARTVNETLNDWMVTMVKRARQAATAFFRQESFVIRWIVAGIVSLGVVSLGEYAVASRQFEQRFLEHIAEEFGTHIAEMKIPATASRNETLLALERVVQDIAGQDEVLYVGVFDSEGQEVIATARGDEEIDPADLEDVVASQRPVFAKEVDPGERQQSDRYEFILPVSTPTGVLAMKIDKRSGEIGQFLSDLRQREILGLVAVTLIAVPMSYLLGGRTLRRRHSEAHRLSSTDELTGIPGRRPFRPLLGAALIDPANAWVSLAIFDIDHFKDVNDTMGHSYGDRVLMALGQSFDALRASDTAFRLGGDEFAIVLPGIRDPETKDVLERVRGALAKRIPEVTISAGVASVRHEDMVSMQELWERADSALYHAKRLGRNRTVAFSSLTAGVTVAADKLDAVHDLCNSKIGCSVAFQPIWDLSRGCILGHEALLRLPSDLPLGGPAEAFELADRVGLAAELDAIARREVLEAVRTTPWSGGWLFINVHPAALREFDFNAFAVEVIAAGLSHTDVVLEITEHADLDNASNIRGLKRASACGFRLALDDLGSGNAGLRALNQAQFEVIKLDRAVTSRLGIDPAADAVLAAASAFVRGTGGWVIAEGIEDKDRLDAVLADSTPRVPSALHFAGQGYLLGYPVGRPQPMNQQHALLDNPQAPPVSNISEPMDGPSVR